MYTCTWKDCLASFRRKDRFEGHIRSHTGEKPFVCSHPGCEKNFKLKSKLNRHLSTHIDGQFRCSYKGCCKILKSKKYLTKHIKLMHSNLNLKTYMCKTCGKTFNKHSWLNSHEASHAGVLPHKCTHPGCEKYFAYPSKLRKHMKVHSGYTCDNSDCDEWFNTWSECVKHTKINHPKIHKCPTCQKGFLRTTNLKEHLKVHSEAQETFPCEVSFCSRFYRAKRNLVFHMQTYHEARPHVCPHEFCRKAFKTVDNLNCHIKKHTASREKKRKNGKTMSEKLSGFTVINEPESSLSKNQEVAGISDFSIQLLESSNSTEQHFTAEYGSTKSPNVGKTMQSPKYLNEGKSLECTVDEDLNIQNVTAVTSHSTAKKSAHYERLEGSHSGALPCKCPHLDCKKEFPNPNGLKKHMKVHKGYTCDKPDCSQHFSKWSEYVKHTKMNHPKIHKCPTCEKVFRRSYNLKQHIKLHGDQPDFPCDIPHCNRIYKSRHHLDSHIKTYHEARPHLCQHNDCHKAFKTARDLTTHMRRHPFSKTKKQGEKLAKESSSCTSSSKPESSISRRNEIMDDAYSTVELIGNSSPIELLKTVHNCPKTINEVKSDLGQQDLNGGRFLEYSDNPKSPETNYVKVHSSCNVINDDKNHLLHKNLNDINFLEYSANSRSPQQSDIEIQKSNIINECDQSYKSLNDISLFNCSTNPKQSGTSLYGSPNTVNKDKNGQLHVDRNDNTFFKNSSISEGNNLVECNFSDNVNEVGHPTKDKNDAGFHSGNSSSSEQDKASDVDQVSNIHGGLVHLQNVNNCDSYCEKNNSSMFQDTWMFSEEAYYCFS